MVASAAASSGREVGVVAGAGLSERRRMAIFFVMAVGQFMALLDIQIVASSMNAIQAGLSAAADEIDWLQTAYLMAEIVMIPLSAYLAQALSTRWMFVASAGLFTVASLMCGLAWDLQSMLLFRVVQGFVGGAMIPLVFATGFSFFDGPRRAMVTSVLGVISTLSPALGPAVGGWITDTESWRWLFLINVVPGALVTAGLVWLGPFDRAQPSLLPRIDWVHAASLAVFLGGLQYVLEEGPRHQWFADATIASVAWIAAVGAVVFFERCFFSHSPVVSLAPFRRKGFWAAGVLSFVTGVGLYTITYLTPVFLARVRDFPSHSIGLTTFVAGVFMTASAPVAAWTATKIDMRICMAIGLVLYALSFWMISAVGSDWGFWQLFWIQAVRGAGVLFCMVPSVSMALNNLPDAELKPASGLINLMRNLGGALGIALVNTGLQRYFAWHVQQLAQSLGRAPQDAMAAVAGLAQRLAIDMPSPDQAPMAARAAIGQMVAREALTGAFQDVFRLCAWVFIAALAAVPFCRGGSMMPDETQHHH
ncbi:DHA2 family efflux MFS transporter permease subunit [Caulobacter sp. KR2-114]|uniref:DHA2 family efflux MFS transporter permease subunit n=1 Tax=Caulobacter sp. KR2-114 TaxID=3400912 RepID=UPI003C116536